MSLLAALAITAVYSSTADSPSPAKLCSGDTSGGSCIWQSPFSIDVLVMSIQTRDKKISRSFTLAATIKVCSIMVGILSLLQYSGSPVIGKCHENLPVSQTLEADIERSY